MTMCLVSNVFKMTFWHIRNVYLNDILTHSTSFINKNSYRLNNQVLTNLKATIGINKKVSWFNVSMDDVSRVQIFQTYSRTSSKHRHNYNRNHKGLFIQHLFKRKTRTNSIFIHYRHLYSIPSRLQLRNASDSSMVKQGHPSPLSQ